MNGSHVKSGTLAAYVDGELPAQEAAAVEAHLLSCDRCYQQALQQRQTAGLLRNAAMEAEKASLQNSGGKLTQLHEAWAGFPAARPAAVRPPSSWLIAAAFLIGFLLLYGIQSLVSDMLERSRAPVTGRVAALVEDHIAYETYFDAAHVQVR